MRICPIPIIHKKNDCAVIINCIGIMKRNSSYEPKENTVKRVNDIATLLIGRV
ncbi:hypothetical protein DBS1_30177 [Escherichia coli]|nr:hypothetical protein DBS1_30177 [Escherichia coli]VEW04964.1 hypothetical protein CRJUMX01_360042 [Escherichia coli]